MGVWGFKDTVIPHLPFHCRSPKEVGDVIALSDITPSGAADHSQEPSPVGSRRGRITPNLSRASSDADHGVSRRREEGAVGKRQRKAGGGVWERGGDQGGKGQRDREEVGGGVRKGIGGGIRQSWGDGQGKQEQVGNQRDKQKGDRQMERATDRRGKRGMDGWMDPDKAWTGQA